MDNKLQNVRDTFLHFLSDNLTGVIVHPRRIDEYDPAGDDFAENAVNVEYVGISLGFISSEQEVALDVIYTNERDAVDVVHQVWTLLSSAFYTPVKDYTVSSTPTTLDKHLVWSSVRFKKVYSGEYTHFVCLMSLKFDTR